VIVESEKTAQCFRPDVRRERGADALNFLGCNYFLLGDSILDDVIDDQSDDFDYQLTQATALSHGC
jgi:hypothetical protein